MTAVDVICVDYNCHEITRRMIDMTSRIGLVSRVIIVDNGSDQPFSADVDLDMSKVLLLRFPDNSGFGPAVNKAWEYVSSEYVLVVNPDVKGISEQSLCFMVGYLDKHPEVGVAAPRLLNEDGSVQRSWCGRQTPLAMIVEPLWPRAIYPKVGADEVHVWAVSGASMVLRASTFKRLGGFDESYFMYMEDVDLCDRYHNAGLAVVMLTKVAWIHTGGGASKDPVLALFRLIKSRMIYIAKYGRFYPTLLTAAEVVGTVIRAMLRPCTSQNYRGLTVGARIQSVLAARRSFLSNTQ